MRLVSKKYKEEARRSAASGSQSAENEIAKKWG
jgi:hypothetical protein